MTNEFGSQPAGTRLDATQPVVPAMHGRYGGFLRHLFAALFGPIHYPVENAERIRELAARGVVVYSARAPSLLLALYFNHALHRLGLPLAGFVGGVNLVLWQPVDRLLHLLRRPGQPTAGPWQLRFSDRPATRSEGWLATVLNRGQSAFLFLPPPRVPGRWRRSRTSPHDYLRMLIAVQRAASRRIFVVPHVLTERGLGGEPEGLTAQIFGDKRSPGGLRRLVMLLSTYRHATVKVSETIDLHEFVAAAPDVDDAALARRLQHELARRMDAEERVVAGPVLPTPVATVRHVLRDPDLRALIEKEAAKREGKTAAVEARVRGSVREMAAKYNTRLVQIAAGFMTWVFSRIYDGILVDEDGLKRALAAARKGPLVFCPSHRSHIDYLVLSYVLWRHGIAPPHIAAGANLAFFPLGSIFRRLGAFFLRRSFHGDPLYVATFRAYVRELVKTGISVEVFLEGTRSRTGKMLAPRLGILSMLVEAWRQSGHEDLTFIPVSIDYERIIEAHDYERELLGAEKKPENLGGLLRTTQVLRSRYGRVHIEFGNPISLANVGKRAALDLGKAVGADADWRQLTERLGYRILHHVAMVCAVTPTAVVATALLSHRARGLAGTQLVARGNEIVEFLDEQAARLAEPLQSAVRRGEALAEAANKLAKDGLLRVEYAGPRAAEPIYLVPDDKRILLDYHKNALMNAFAPVAMIARSVLRRREKTVMYAEVAADARFLSRLFKREFLYRADADFATHFDDALASLAIRGYLDVQDDGTITLRQVASLKFLAALLDNFVQAYWVTAAALPALKSFPLWQRELRGRVLEHARRAFWLGEISRPEAINRTLIDNAIGWLIASGVILESPSGGRKSLRLSDAYAADRLDALVGDLKAFVAIDHVEA